MRTTLVPRFSRALPLLAALAAGAAGATPALAAPLQPTAKLAGPATAGGLFSSATAPAGDVNRDGLADLVLQLPDRYAVVFGTRAGAGPRLPSDGGAGFEIRLGTNQGEGAVTPAGDVDGDGFDDLLVPGSGRSFVVYGAADAGNVDLGTAQPRVTAIEHGTVPGLVGIVGAGDFDGDGYDDLVTRVGTGAAILRGGSRVASLSATAAGPRRVPITGIRSCYWRAVIFYTCATDLKAPQPVGDVNGDGQDDLFMPDRGFVLLGRTGTATIAGSGPDGRSFSTRGVGGVPEGARPGGFGDLTGDGIDDLVGRPAAADGVWHVIPGRAGTSGTLDVAGAGVLSIKPASLSDLVWIRPAGDVTGDGRADLAVTVAEQVRIVAGRATSATVTLDASTPPLALPLGDLRDDFGYPSGVGVAAEGAGDLDGDGSADLFVSSPNSDDEQLVNRGALFLLTSGPDRLAPALYPRGTTNPELASNVTPSVFAAAPGGSGTTLRINLLEAASVELTIRREGGAVLSTETRAGLPAGITAIAWDGRGRGVDGAPGRYLLQLQPVDAAGNRGAAQSIPFEVSGTPSVTPPTLQVTRREVVPAGTVIQPPRGVYPYGDPVFRRVQGDCPDELLSLALTETPREVPLNDPRAGDQCTLNYQPPPATGNDGYPPLPADPAKHPWRTTVVVNGGSPVLLNVPVEDWVKLPVFALRNGLNTVEIVDRWDDSGLQVPDSDVTGTLAWSFPGSGGGFTNAAAGDPATSTGLQLTAATANQVGVAVACPSVFSANAMTVEFDAEMAGGSGAGHGLSFAVFNQRPATLLASNANVGFGWVGYAGTAFGLITAKERYNPANNFVGIASGTVGKSGYPTWLATAIPGRSLAGATTRVKIVVSGGTATFSLDGNEMLRRAVTFPAGACLGFTAATGTRTQRHLVKNLRVRST